MQTRRQLVVLCYAFWTLATLPCESAAQAYPRELGTGAYIQEVETQRTHMVEMMIGALRSGGLTDGQKGEAIQVLGRIRATESVAVLIENIALAPNPKLRELGSLEDSYPCLGALSRIGNEASEAILGQLEKDIPKVNRHLFTCAIRNIEGSPFARVKLETRIAKTGDVDKKRRLREVVDKLSNDEQDAVGR